MTREQDWQLDRQRFVAEAGESERQGRASLRDHGFPLGPLGLQFATLTYALLDAHTVEEVLEQVVRAAVQIVPSADVVSVTLRSDDGAFHTPVYTDPIALKIDELQYSSGEGPCVTAASMSGPAMAAWSDLRLDGSPWPDFAPAALHHGIRAVLSFSLIPAPISPRLSGALNLYSRTAEALDNVDEDLILLLATHASLAVATTHAVTTAGLQEAQLRRAIDSRDVIGQAKGVLMHRRGISAGEAFDTLRRTSQSLNRKLVEIAEMVAERPDLVD